MECKDFRPLVPLYLDGELSEAQAAPLRKHLLSCHACRDQAQSEKALKRWFVPSPAVRVPQGFAAHVVHRALAGDEGRRPLEVAGQGVAAVHAEAGLDLRPFVLAAVALAAGLLLVLSLALQRHSVLPERHLSADELPAAMKHLEGMNHGLAPSPPAGKSALAGGPASNKPGQDPSSPAKAQPGAQAPPSK